MPTNNQSFYLSNSIAPTLRKKSAVVFSPILEHFLFNADEANLTAASGGFNSVVQFHSNYCFKLFKEYLPIVESNVKPLADSLTHDLTLLKELGFEYDNVILETASTADLWWGIAASLAQFTFKDNHEIEITYEGTLKLLTRQVIPYYPPRPIEVILPTHFHNSAINPSAAKLPSSLSNIRSFNYPDYAGFFNKNRSIESMQEVLNLGTISISCTVPYYSTEYKPQKAVDVMLDLAKATTKLNSNSIYALKIYDNYQASFDRSINDQLAARHDLKLIPTVSICGSNATNAPIDEITEFETRTGHIDSLWGQAFFIAFDMMPSCQGITKAVKNFIGFYEYGVIHDEYTIKNVFKHKWNRGGFDRSLKVEHTTQIKVQRNGRDRVEDARVKGRMLLNSLDQISLETNANSRQDSLLLSGMAQVVADQLILQDGQIVTRDQVDLGPTESSGWGVRLYPTLNPQPSNDIELNEFQARAHIDGYSPLSRPFKQITYQAKPIYVRLEAVQKRYYVLGLLDI